MEKKNTRKAWHHPWENDAPNRLFFIWSNLSVKNSLSTWLLGKVGECLQWLLTHTTSIVVAHVTLTDHWWQWQWCRSYYGFIGTWPLVFSLPTPNGALMNLWANKVSVCEEHCYQKNVHICKLHRDAPAFCRTVMIYTVWQMGNCWSQFSAHPLLHAIKPTFAVSFILYTPFLHHIHISCMSALPIWFHFYFILIPFAVSQISRPVSFAAASYASVPLSRARIFTTDSYNGANWALAQPGFGFVFDIFPFLRLSLSFAFGPCNSW